MDVEVAFRGFGFQESDDTVVPVPFGDGYEWGVFLKEHERSFDLLSAGHTHTATMEVSVWDFEPLAAEATGMNVARSTSRRPAGRRCVDDGSRPVGPSGPTGEVGVVAGPGGCIGRDEVARVTQLEGVAYGVEKYVVGFWPEA
ncbi:hypothetical protein ABZ958_32145 [Streptomyces sp. NPDC046237]|uniref:hypothetical protein n=1 Tax=Streptomyces sp. NPDC046237 TaxID=3154914 RepID=UPI0033DFB6F7